MGINHSFDIAAQGLETAGERLRIYANNVANLNTPYYKRKIPVVVENHQMRFESLISQMQNGVMKTGVSNATGGVTLAGVADDPTQGKRVYQPGHPEADKDGYVTYSNVNVLNDMADAMMTQRLYEANLAVVGIAKAMANRALEIGRGQ
ncbi:MAG: flagellar basal body rod protein FlgC [Vampirovibrionales bacterium]